MITTPWITICQIAGTLISAIPLSKTPIKIEPSAPTTATGSRPPRRRPLRATRSDPRQRRRYLPLATELRIASMSESPPGLPLDTGITTGFVAGAGAAAAVERAGGAA